MKSIAYYALFVVFWSVSLCADAEVQVNENTANEVPNILFIYTDDQAPWAIGVSGNEQIHTPNLDALAKQGLYFPNSYTTTPVCSPARAGLLTSQYGYELGIDDWINVKAKTLTEHQPNLGLDPQHETWPEVLKQSGYITGLIGKWHLGYQAIHHPTKHGYDEFVGFVGGGTTPVNPLLEVNGEEYKAQGLTVDILTQHAVEFIRKHKDEKFALSLHYRAPHYRFLPVAPEDEAHYEDREIALPHPEYPDLNVDRATTLMREYMSSVSGIDRNVGMLLDELKRMGLEENTLVIFTSDHGYNIAHNGMWHKGNGFWLLNSKSAGSENVPPGQRPNMYDNSLKVPTLVRWPSVIPANSVNFSTMSNLDWFPTLTDIAGGNPSKDNTIRGQSYLPVFRDPSQVISTDYYAAYTTLHQSRTQMRMYSDGKYKLVKDFLNPERDEMYDLATDPDEQFNIINTTDDHLKGVKASLLEQLLSKMGGSDDPILQGN
ncbi:sulfatase-like hydrolase/transferase [Alteromonas sp. KUL49]|uniref:sulfatase-like hydrolase/transferase n=1 Tax=Alteromonas sp. KUL49 TaxID=2480798 RepID=UPI00102F238E|nr:sulfatase-like hydrolase/transferase [Alteromonas sp. KUL49]TAP37301.1 DUF4976 domain-containing protein [Alteromonas sp. KUL49]GEA12922.1 N-acetylgalactosamine-6-sulfatase [Alteromonas sp. KUL49]